MEKLTFKEEVEKACGQIDSPLVKKWYRDTFKKVEQGYRVIDMLSEHTDIHGRKVLDVGCGDGGISIAFAQRGARVVGIDYNPERIRLANLRALEHRVDAKFLVNTAEDIKLPDNYFDIIVCNAVIEHVFNPEKLANEISRLLKPGGFFFLDTPNRYSIWQLISDTHYNLFGISIMPRWMAAFYTVKIRKRYYKYDVADLRTYRYLKSIYIKNNIVFLEDANISFLVQQIEENQLVLNSGSGIRRKIIATFNRLHMSWFLIAFVKSWVYRTLITSGWSLIGKKVQ